MKKKFLIFNIIMLLAIIIMDICYMTMGGLLFKSITSSFFVLTGIINIVYARKCKVNLKYPIWMGVALVFAMLGDIWLNLIFYAGVGLFALGHILYFVSYAVLKKIRPKDFVYSVICMAIALFVLIGLPILKFDSITMQVICSIYALIISCMVGKAISNYVEEKNPSNTIIVIGSILFFISDMMLAFNMFGQIPYTGKICLSTYYPAQFLLAFSIFSYTNQHKKETSNS